MNHLAHVREFVYKILFCNTDVKCVTGIYILINLLLFGDLNYNIHCIFVVKQIITCLDDLILPGYEHS